MAGEILPDKLYTVEEVSDFLGGVHRRTVWRLLRDGVIVGRHIGRRWYVRGSDLLAAGEAAAAEAEEPPKVRGKKAAAEGPVRLRRQEPKKSGRSKKQAAGRVEPRVIG